MDGQVERPSERECTSQTPYSLRLFAPGLDGRNSRQIRWEAVCGIILNRHLNQADERTAKIRFRFAAPIDNHSYCRDHTAMCADDIDCFLHPSATGHHIFDKDKFFPRRNLKTAAQDELAILLLNKDVAFT